MKKSIALFTGALMLCALLSGLTSGSRAAAYPSYYYEGLWDNFLSGINGFTEDFMSEGRIETPVERESL